MRAARSTVRLAASALIALCLGTVTRVPRAQTPPRTERAATTVPIGCVLTGTSQLGPRVQIFDSQRGGSVIARFTGGESPLQIDAFPPQPGRARVVTATGNGGFRITGFVDAMEVPVFTRREVPVVKGHVWIEAQREVRVLRGTTARLEVRKALTQPLRQNFDGWGPCDAFALERGTPAGWDVPGDARGFKVKKDSLQLYDGWNEDQTKVATLSNASGMLLWGIAERGSSVRVQYHGEIGIEAWARVEDLHRLPRGEREDSLDPPARRRAPPRLKLASVPTEVTTTRSISIRTQPAEKGTVIGVIEPNTETYVLDVVVGWASVLPKSLHVAPDGDGQFWVPANELGLED